MADLENLLLEAAGRNRHPLPPSRRGHDVAYSDGGNDSGDDSSDDEPNYTDRKSSGSHAPPFKKRTDPAAKRDGDMGKSEGDVDVDVDRGDNQDESSDESHVGDDLYKNDDDRRKLFEMTELEREMILSDRATKKGDKTLLGKIVLKLDKGNTTVPREQTPPPPSSRVRSSARSADRSAAKDDALNELRAKRLKQQDSEANRRLIDASRNSAPDLFSSKRMRVTSTSVGSSSESENRSHSDDEDIIGSYDDRTKFEAPSFEDIKEITISRSKLAKWFMEPFFEELIVGCFVRVGIGRSKSGPMYRLSMVKNVDAMDPDRQYSLENKTTYKYLNLVWGNDASAARWQMAMVSESAPLEEEFKQLVKEVERTGGRMPVKKDVLEKKQAIQKINTYVYSAATVKQMLQEKKSASSRPLNIAAEKDRLRKELVKAQSMDDEAEVERIMTRLQELEASRKVQEKDTKALKLAEMNRKNRFENFKNASQLKPKNTGLKAGEAGYDPFSRRWTRSRNYYAAEPGEEAKAAKNSASGPVVGTGSNGTGAAVTSDAGAAATAVALEAAAGAGKLVDTSAPVDQETESNLLHNFELPISLTALQNFGGAQGVHAGYMARKQRIEATVGVQVPEDDEKKHPLTLSVSDYKRRRGLL